MVGTFTEKAFEGEDAKSIYYFSDSAIKNAEKMTFYPFHGYICGSSIDNLTVNILFMIEDTGGSTSSIELVGSEVVPVQKNNIWRIGQIYQSKNTT